MESIHDEFLNILQNKLKGGDLMNYQSKIVEYFTKTNKNILLLYMKVGTGKTLTSLASAITLIKLNSKLHNKFNKIIILSPKSVQHEFKSNLKLYQTFTEYNSNINNMIHMIAYNGNNAQEKFKKLNIKEDAIFIIDELHLFLRSVIKVNLLEDQSKNNVGNCKKILDLIQNCKNKRVLGLTGTPSAKMPFELVPFFNLEPSINLPTNIEKFNELYVNQEKKCINNEEKLKKILKGTIVYVDKLDTQELKISKSKNNSDLIEEEIEMSTEQYKKYLKDYESELNEVSFTNKKNIYGISFGVHSTFHSKTFQDSIYVSELKGDYNKFIDSTHTPKIIKMYDDTKNIKGLCAFYFKFVDFGVKTMEAKLIKEGYSLFKVKSSSSTVFNFQEEFKGKHYILFTGNESFQIRNKYKEIFNSKENKYGEYIKYIIISPSGSVGVTLKNVRYLGIGSVEFNYSMINQIMGRVNRLNSHIDLPVKDRTLINKIYISTKNEKYYEKNKTKIDKICYRTTYNYENEKGLCIERIIYQDSLSDDIINEKFREILKEISIL